MKNRFAASAVVLVTTLVLVAVSPAILTGQRAATAAHTSGVPRTPDGQLDIQGFWGAEGVATYDVEYGQSPIELKILGREARPFKSVVVDPPDGKLPYQPWAAAQARENRQRHVLEPGKVDLRYVDPLARCYLAGMPRHAYLGDVQILQQPGYLAMVAERMHSYRIIRLDGRPRPAEHVKLWMGFSQGRWEGNTLVVETTNLNDKTWFDIAGNFHSDSLRVLERFAVVDRNRIDYEVTITDPKVFTRPWKMAFPMVRNTEEGFELLEDACREGNTFEADVLSR